MKTALFPGSFDPFTNGHLDIVTRGLNIFDKIVIGIGINSQKKYVFSLDKRLQHIEKIFENEPRVSVTTYSQLTVNYCQEIKAGYLLRGLRNPLDFTYEKNISQMNSHLNKGIETVFLMTSPGLSAISSSIVRDIWVNKGEINVFVPEASCLK